MTIIDTHTHLYLDAFTADIDQVIARAQAEAISRMYLPAIDSETMNDVIALEERFPGVCFAMAGLHPCSVRENFRDELALVEDWLSKRPFAGIGETGLDYYWDKTFQPQQKESFLFQIELAGKYDLPVIIHSRESTQDCIDLVKTRQDGRLRGIFHCFTGTLGEARQITELGFHLGIGGVLTYKNSNLREVLQAVDNEWIVLETDAPYLSPVPFRGKRNESAYLVHVIGELARVKNIDIELLAEITTNNAKYIFSNSFDRTQYVP